MTSMGRRITGLIVGLVLALVSIFGVGLTLVLMFNCSEWWEFGLGVSCLVAAGYVMLAAAFLIVFGWPDFVLPDQKQG